MKLISEFNYIVLSDELYINAHRLLNGRNRPLAKISVTVPEIVLFSCNLQVHADTYI